MKINKFLLGCAALAVYFVSPLANAFNIYVQVHADGADELALSNGSVLTAGSFTLKIGYFNYDANYALNNAAIASAFSLGNTASLLSNFTQMYSVNGTEGNNDTIGTNADVGENVFLPGSLVAYLKITDANYTASYSSFAGKTMYAWFTSGSEMAIFSQNEGFITGLNAFDNINDLAIENGQVDTVVGSYVGNQFRLVNAVPEPTTGLLIAFGAGALALARRRRA